MSGKILIVDDEPQAVREMMEFLRRKGLEVTGTSDPRVALDAIAHDDSLCTVITDLKMPHVDGFRIIAAAHGRRQAGRLATVMAITGHATEDDERRAIGSGAEYFFSKPVELPAILQALRAAGVAPENMPAEPGRTEGHR